MTVRPGNCRVDPRRTVARIEQGSGTVGKLGSELRPLLDPEAGSREGLGIIGDQQLFTIDRVYALSSKARRYHRHAMGKGLQKLDPRPAASAHRDDRDIGRGIERGQVFDEAVKPHIQVPNKAAEGGWVAGSRQIDADLSIG